MKKLYIGNLSYSATESDLREAFAKYQSVGSIKVITDRDTGESRGFGFVEMNDADEASTAISEMDGSSLKGSTLRVNEARPQASGGGARNGGFNRSAGRDSGFGRSSRY